MHERFSGILIAQEGPVWGGRNAEGRPLFRYNAISKDFAVYRSHRMTQEERDFCVKMLGRIAGLEGDELEEARDEMLEFLEYGSPYDTYCS